MKKIIIVIFATVFLLVIQGNSSEIKNLEKLRINLDNSDSLANIEAYIKSFPKDFESFKLMFYGTKNELGELYKTHSEHMNALWKLSKEYPGRILELWFSIALNGHGGSDAITILQIQILKFGIKNTVLFSNKLNKFSKDQRKSIIKFLADIEDHNQYYEYKALLSELKKQNKSCLFNLFNEAKIKRMKYRHD